MSRCGGSPGAGDPGEHANHPANDATNVSGDGTALVALIGTLAGERALILVPELREAYPPIVREGLARRRIVAAGGACPCGAVMQLPGRRARRAAKRAGVALSVIVEHQDDCPAPTERLRAAGWTG
jgi:hypothetical protein